MKIYKRISIITNRETELLTWSDVVSLLSGMVSSSAIESWDPESSNDDNDDDDDDDDEDEDDMTSLQCDGDTSLAQPTSVNTQAQFTHHTTTLTTNISSHIHTPCKHC